MWIGCERDNGGIELRGLVMSSKMCIDTDSAAGLVREDLLFIVQDGGTDKGLVGEVVKFGCCSVVFAT